MTYNHFDEVVVFDHPHCSGRRFVLHDGGGDYVVVGFGGRYDYVKRERVSPAPPLPPCVRCGHADGVGE